MRSDLLIPAGMGFWRAMMAGYVEPLADPHYLAFVASLPCCVTGRTPVTVHHLVGHGLKPVGGKTGDHLTIPLVPELHLPDYPEGIHQLGHKEWERRFGDQRVFVMQTLIEAVYRGVLKIGGAK